MERKMERSCMFVMFVLGGGGGGGGGGGVDFKVLGLLQQGNGQQQMETTALFGLGAWSLEFVFPREWKRSWKAVSTKSLHPK